MLAHSKHLPAKVKDMIQHLAAVKKKVTALQGQ